MADQDPAPTARFVAHSVFATLESRGWERQRSHWVVAEASASSRADRKPTRTNERLEILRARSGTMVITVTLSDGDA